MRKALFAIALTAALILPVVSVADNPCSPVVSITHENPADLSTLSLHRR